ncbi:F-box/LRR-repeat protein 6-like [Rana temporaria]|uniref:F-box/LRR-repeat protein 6-like n=1 Tax=Rana temporaria TaxID=8407 RepID=UPI001AAC660B|nr:F-box/LRR-repeat protein 6-like [Rana temporaria]
MSPSRRKRGRPKKHFRNRQQSQNAGPSCSTRHTDKTNRQDLEETISAQNRGHEETSMDTEDAATDFGWSSIIPVEILLRVFLLLAESEGAVPVLCRVSRVCRLWRQIASSKDLWRRVTVSRCWVIPDEKDPPRTRKRMMKAMETLIQQRLPRVSDFSLHKWKVESSVSFVLQNLSQSCPLLTSLTLSHCHQVTEKDLLTIGRCCPRLQNLNLQNSKVQFDAVQRFLEKYGARIRRLSLSYTLHMNSIMAGISRGWCPELRLLGVNVPMTAKVMTFPLSIEGFQASCPKLEVLRFINVPWQAKPEPELPAAASGFPELKELWLSKYVCTVTDDVCQKLLKGSRKLRVLVLHGCCKISPQALSALPCTDVERLNLGMSCRDVVPAIVSGSHLLTSKWRHSLKELDLKGQFYTEEDLAEAFLNLTRGGGGGNGTLRSLNLAGTRATPHAVRDVLLSCQALTHLDLSSCQHIPQGLDRVYHGRGDIKGCLTDLTQSLQEIKEQTPDEELPPLN